MHITFVTTHFPPSQGFGGVCESSHGLATALARAGVTVDVVASDASKGNRIHFDDFLKYEEPNLHIHPFKYLASERSCFSFEALSVLNKLAPDSDLIHVNGIFTHPVMLGAWMARRFKKPHIIAVRNGLDPWLFRIRSVRKLVALKLYVEKDLRSANCIHATARHEVHACRAFGLNGPFTIIPNGINPEHYQNLPDQESVEEAWPALKGKTVVLFLSRLGPQKGLDLLIPSWDEIKKKFPDAFLVIAGPDYMGFSAKVRRLVDRSAFPDSILLTGGVWGIQKLALYSRADLFVLPSYSENFGNVVAEALVCGTPVVTTQATPWKALENEKCGRWVPVDKSAITSAISELIEKSDSERKEMGLRGRQFILSKYTWDISARKMINVYHSILNGTSIPLYPELNPMTV